MTSRAQLVADRVARLLAVIAAVSGVGVMLAWATGHTAWLGLAPDWVPIAPLTGLVVTLLAAVTWASTIRPATRAARALCLGLNALVIALAVQSLLREYQIVELPLERWLSGTSEMLGGVTLGRMGAITAYLVLAIAAACVLRTLRGRGPQFAALLNLAALLVAAAILEGYALDAPPLYGSGVIPVAAPTALLLAVLSTAGVLVSGVTLWPLSLLIQDAEDESGRASRGPLLFLGALLMTVFVSAGLYWYVGEVSRSRRESAEALLLAVDLKAAQIAAWHEGYLSTARAFERLPLSDRGAAALHSTTTTGRDWLAAFVLEDGYAAAALYDAKGNPIRYEPQTIEPVGAAVRLRQLISAGQRRLQSDNLQRYGSTLAIDTWIPLGDGPENTWLLLRIDPRRALFPLVNERPLRLNSAEFVLWREEGDSAVVLNELRHRSDAVLRIRVPIGHSLAGRAIREHSRELEDVDYRGVPVIAAAARVPGTPWILIAKVDRAEVAGPAARTAVRLVSLLLLLLLVTGSSALALTQRRQLVASEHRLELVRARERADTDRRRTEDRYARVIRATNDAIWEWNLGNDSVYVSPRYLELAGLDAANATDAESAFFQRVFADDIPLARAALADHLEGDAPLSVELRLRDGRGGTRWVWLRGETERDAAGRPTTLFAALSDITERREAQERATLFRALIDDSADSIFIVDLATGRFVDFNETAHRELGYRAEELRELGPQHIVEGFTDLPHWQTDVEAQPDGRANTRRYVHRRKDGTTFPSEVSRSVVDVGGQRLVLAVARDITELVRREQERAELQDQLLRAQRMESVGRLAGGIAHDFNNLLTVINTTTDLTLAEVGLDSPLRNDLLGIRAAATRAATLTRQLLAFSRQQVLRRSVVDLNALIREFHRLVRRVIGEDVTITLDLHPQPLRILADPSQIEQVLMNLCINARDAMPRGGVLTLRTSSAAVDTAMAEHRTGMGTGAFALLTISDTGTGMPPEVQERIFDPFFTTKEAGKGTGLGLSTVYGIVKQSDGSIWVDSEVGRGTTFEIYLPLTSADEADYVERPSGPSHAIVDRRGPETILIVEDEPSIRMVVSRILAKSGYTVLEASSGDEALEKVANLTGDLHLVMTDLVMPGISGIELATTLRARFPNLPILLSSGYSAEALTAQLGQRESFAMISKPYSVDDLLKEVRSLLDGGSAT